MNDRFLGKCLVRGSVRLMVTVLFLSLGCAAWAEDGGESFTPSLLPSSGQEDQAVLSRRLQAARKDLEAFRVFAEHFSASSETKTAGQFQGPIDDYLKRHVDRLLTQARENSTVEIIRLSAEIMLAKTRLQLALNRAEEARSTLAEMKKRFAPYQRIAVQLAGKTTTLDEIFHQLDKEVAKATPAKKI